MKNLCDLMENEIKLDSAYDLEHPQRKKFQKFLDNVIEGGCILNKIKIRYHDENYRSIHAAFPFNKDEMVIKIKLEKIITKEIALEKCEMNKQLMENEEFKKFKNITPILMSNFIQQELKKGEESPYFTYLNILPLSVDEFPTQFEEEDLKWLEGCEFLHD